MLPAGDSVSSRVRSVVKAVLALGAGRRRAEGATVLIYHRVGGGTADELDVPTDSFRGQLDLLDGHDVVGLDKALDRLDRGDVAPSVVLTFDDGFQDVYANAWPLLRERQLPFTIYLASAYMGQTMRWEGSTARGQSGRGLSWPQLREMVASGLCTVGNHTHTHVRPGELSVEELDAANAAVEEHLGRTPRHFTYPWGVVVSDMEPELRARFRSASTGQLGRNLPQTDRMRLRRVPVRRTDPDSFFAAKLTGALWPERAYAAIVGAAKALGMGS